MIEVPSTGWRSEPWTIDEAVRAAPGAAGWSLLPGVVLHGFTHFRLELAVVSGEGSAADGLWARPDRLGEHALPTLMKKVVQHAVSALSVPLYESGAKSGSSPARAKRTGAKDRR
jgi:A/G-specific adenine glycosylase